MAIEITSQRLAGVQPEEMAAYKESRPPAISRFLPAAKSSWRSRFWRRTPRWTRRNFSSRARELSGGDAIVISIPNSGRTWVRTFLCAYFCKRTGHPFTLRPDRYHEPNIGIAAVKVLEALGFEVELLQNRKCCGRPAFSQGNLDAAAEVGQHNVDLANTGVLHIRLIAPTTPADRIKTIAENAKGWRTSEGKFGKQRSRGSGEKRRLRWFGWAFGFADRWGRDWRIIA